MKKIFSSLVLLFFIVQISNPLVIYASMESSLQEVKEETTTKLETLEVIADRTITTLETKTESQEIESQLEEKSQEIETYLEEVKAEVQNAGSSTEVQAILSEAKQVVTLKVVAGATEYSDIEEGLPEGKTLTISQKEDAIEVLQDTVIGDDFFTLIIATRYTQSQVQSLFEKFDTNIEVGLLYSVHEKNYFEIRVSKQSIFAQEFLGKIQTGDIPETFVGIEIVQPEVFVIEEAILPGEGIDSVWGVKSYNPGEYLQSGVVSQESRVKVGVVDTGIHKSHPDLIGNISPTLGYDFVNEDNDASDDQGHGTHVAGTIAAMNNGSGIIGVNPNVELIPLKICNASGFCPNYAIIKALEYAKMHHIPVLNMSLGGRGTVQDNPICAGIESITLDGTIVVSAAGNSNVDTSTFIPGGCPQAITVGAYDQLKKRASFSNFGSKVDVSAPGVSIYSTHLNSSYKNLSGTSMATPHIVGVISLLKSIKPTITRAEVISLFNQHKVLLNAEVGKSIASGVDVAGLLSSLSIELQNLNSIQETDEEETGEVQTQMSVQNPASPISGGENNPVTLNPNITYDLQQQAKVEEVQARNAQLIEQANTEEQTVGISNVILDFLGLGARTIISENDTSITPVEEILPLPQEAQKGQYHIEEVQYLDENGNPLSDVTIANLDDTGEVITPPLLPLGQAPQYELFPENTGNTVVIDDPEIEPEMHEILVDGAERPVIINSLEDESLVEQPLQEYVPSQPLDEDGNVIDMQNVQPLNIPIEHFDYSYEEEIFVDGATGESEINSIGGEGFTPLDLENGEVDMSSSIQIPEVLESSFESLYGFLEEENQSIDIQSGSGASISDVDEANLYQEDIGIESIANPLPTTSIFHTFTTLTDTVKYRSFIKKGGLQYTLAATNQGTIVGQDMLAKTSDNFIYSYTNDNYNYGSSVSPISFSGKFKANVATNAGWNQFGSMGIAGTDDSMIFGAYLMMFQDGSVNYSKSRGVDDLCAVNTSIDEVKCLNHTFTSGKYLVFNYKKANGKYTRVTYKLLDTLSGDYAVDFTLDFSGEKLIAALTDSTGVVAQQIFASIAGITQPTGIDFSNYTYYSQAGTTNNSSQKMTPYEIGIGFAPPVLPPPPPLPETPTALNIDMTTSGVVKYGWNDVLGEDSYILKDELGQSVGSVLPTGTQITQETGLSAGTTYQRKICAVNGNGEVCSPLISVSLPVEVSLSMYRTKQVVQPFTTASSYQYTLSEAGKLSVSANTGNLFITGNIEGQHKIYAKLNGVHKYTFNVTVLPWPEPEVVTAIVPELQSISVYFPSGSYQLTRLTTSTGTASASINSAGTMTITGNTKGVVSYSIAPKTGDMSYIPKYILNVTISPAIPTITTRTVWETRGWTDNTLKAGTLSYSEAGIVSGAVVYGDLDFVALKAGYVEIYLKDSYGRHLRTEQVTVLPKPVPQTYTYDLLIEDSVSVTLPEPIANYNITVDNVAIFGKYWTTAITGPNTFYLRSANNGTAVVHLVDKTNGFDKYVITVNVKPREIYYTLNVTDKIDIYYNSNRSYTNLNPDIFFRSGTYVTGLKVGQGVMNATYEGVLKYIYYFTVNPIPEPKQITCNTLAGKDCWIAVNYASVSSYTVTSANVLDKIEKTGSGIRVYTKGSGIITLYLKSVTGQYTSHILTVNVASQPPYEYDCTIPVGYSCLSYDTNVNTGFTFTSTNPTTTNIALLKFAGIGLQSDYYQYRITGLTEGTSDIYIYRYSDHVATVHTTILPPVTPLSLQKSNTTIREGERITGQLTGGVAPYTVKSVKIIEKDAQGNETETTSTDLYTSLNQTTGELTITAKQRPGNYTVELKDKYDQIKKFGVTVLDAHLALGSPAVLTPTKYTLNLTVGDKPTITITDYYVGLQSVTQDTNNVTKTIVDEPDLEQPQKPRKYLLLDARAPGVTKIEILDGENTKVVLEVTVKEKEGNIIESELPLDNEMEEVITEVEVLVNTEYFQVNSLNSNLEISSYTKFRYDELNTIADKHSKYASYLERIYKTVSHLTGVKAREMISVLENRKVNSLPKTRFLYDYAILKLKIAQLEDLPTYTGENVGAGKMVVPEALIYVDKVIAVKLIGYEKSPLQELFPSYLKTLNDTYTSKIKSEKLIVMDELLVNKMVHDMYKGQNTLSEYQALNGDLSQGIEVVSEIILATEEILAEVTDLGLEFTSSKGVIGGLETLFLYYSGEIEDLEAKDDLLSDLNEIKDIVNISKRWEKLKSFGKLVKGKKLVSDWKTLEGITWSKIAKPDVTNTELKRIVLSNYLPTAIVGNGSTADALRFEKKTGILLSDSGHKIKTVELRKRIKSWLNSNASPYGPKASESDIKHAKDMLSDLDSAFNEIY